MVCIQLNLIIIGLEDTVCINYTSAYTVHIFLNIILYSTKKYECKGVAILISDTLVLFV